MGAEDAAVIPQQSLSTTLVPGAYVHGDEHVFSPLADFEPGGVALSDSSGGLFAKLWRLRCINGHDLLLSADGVPETVLISRPGTVTEVSLAFDQNARPGVAFVEDGAAKLYWYDSLAEDFTVTTLAAGVANPRVTMDDKRAMQTAANDIILAYLRSGSLYFRAQRDRYTVEYLLTATPPDGPLRRVSMNNRLRLQFEFGSLEAP